MLGHVCCQRDSGAVERDGDCETHGSLTSHTTYIDSPCKQKKINFPYFMIHVYFIISILFEYLNLNIKETSIK